MIIENANAYSNRRGGVMTRNSNPPVTMKHELIDIIMFTIEKDFDFHRDAIKLIDGLRK